MKNVINNYIYITSNDRINEGDWYLCDKKHIYRGGDSDSLDTDRCKKIIQTSDPNVDGVQKIK